MAASHRFLIRTALSRTVSWKNSSGTAANDARYSLVMGSLSALPQLVFANLNCLIRLDLSNLDEILIVFDGPVPPEVEEKIKKTYPALKCRVLWWSRPQSLAAHFFSKPWINCWLSWCVGIAESRSRYVFLHDLDAMIIQKDFFENRHARIRELKAEYLGVKYYNGNGVVPEDRLSATFELLFDNVFVQKHFKPIDLLNEVTKFRGKTVDFDIFLLAQSLAGKTEILPAPLDDMVHPSQMIGQYTYYMNADRRLPRDGHNLLILPYYLYLGGDERTMAELTQAMRKSESGGWLTLFGRKLQFNCLSPALVEWQAKQIRHLEGILFGKSRPAVEEYLSAYGAANGVK